MVALERGDRLIEMISDEDEDIQAQGWELLRCLAPRTRWRLAKRLLVPQVASWRLAALCVLPEPLALPRLRLFAARCAEWRLEQLRRAGQEPAEWTWRAVEAAAQHAQGKLRASAYERILRETESYRDGWDWEECWTQALGSDMVDFARIPDSWTQDFDEVGVVHDLAQILSRPEDSGLADWLDAQEESSLAEAAAAFCLVDAHEDDCGEWIESIPSSESVREWRWRRRAWQAIVIRGEDGLQLVYGR